MKIPTPLLQLLYGTGAKFLPKVMAMPLEKVPNVDLVAKAYRDGEPLEVIIATYLQATESIKDDELAGKVGDVVEFIHSEVPKILAKFSTEPFNEVLAELLGDLAIPDFDEVKGNEVKVIDLINSVMKELDK